MSLPFQIIEPTGPKVPIILSVPHCGTEFPEEIKAHYKETMAANPDDTDWFVHDLYRFVSEMGITIIHAKYSRWVIDLNRDPESKALYNDGRIITGLCSTTDFFGRDIYVSEDKIPGQEEISRRLDLYYWPYYKKVQSLLDERRKEFGKALLWDGHSIRQSVPTIRKENFPDLILGDNDGKTADSQLIQTALDGLKKGSWPVSHNTPFKGGHITRYFGKPENNIHALQLEMNKIMYMDNTETIYHEERANSVISLLKQTFEALTQTINKL
jgi:N-formylglutamate deformylase